MTYRIGWLSPLTPDSGIGTFTHAIARYLPRQYNGEAIDLTLLYVGHEKLYGSEHRAICIGADESFHRVLSLFDLLVYNTGNNREHHDPIYALLRLYPGIIISHDFVYQNYLADRSQRLTGGFSSLAALLHLYAGDSARRYLRRSRYTSRSGCLRYFPWETTANSEQPMSDPILALGSAVVVHSTFARRYVESCFAGPVMQLGMPHDQKDPPSVAIDPVTWAAGLATKSRFELVFFGHVQATKCIELIFDALASSLTLRRRLHFTIAGFVFAKAYFEHLKAVAARLSLQDCVSFEPEVSERRLAELMRDADIFSNLRRPNTEGSSVSLIEQMKTGKPVLVIDSGCYADVPAGAAVKFSVDVTSEQLGEVLERLIDEPSSMPAIGETGRAFALSWSCAGYAESLLRFAQEHRDLLNARAVAVATRAAALSDSAADDAWSGALARGRRALTYFDRNVLPVDPQLILKMSHTALCEYVAHVLFGVFDDAPLDRALSRFFVRLDGRQRYWACVRFSIIADAAFGENEAARERLVNLRACHDLEFWSVIAALPVRQCLTAATLMLVKRSPNDAELSTCGLDDIDGFPKRLRIAELVRSLDPMTASALGQLGRWLGAPGSPGAGPDPRNLDGEFDAVVGSASFKDRVDLSGFYVMEADHAWTRGPRGFIGLRGDTHAHALEVEVLMRHICASAEHPATMSLSHETLTTSTTIEDCVPRWLSIALPPAAGASEVRWLQLATDLTAVPDASADTRLLGLCILQLRTRIVRDAAELQGIPMPDHAAEQHPFRQVETAADAPAS